MSEVVLVDSCDNELGLMEKLEAHRRGLMHRAVSVIIINARGEMLIQRRALNKYHCPGLWSNTCCTHPFKGESVEEAAKRRLMEEMGFVCELEKIFSFVYCREFENGLIENEFDHVFLGVYNGEVNINLNEVSDFEWISYNDLIVEVKEKKDNFTYWFSEILRRLKLSNVLVYPMK